MSLDMRPQTKAILPSSVSDRRYIYIMNNQSIIMRRSFVKVWHSPCLYRHLCMCVCIRLFSFYLKLFHTIHSSHILSLLQLISDPPDLPIHPASLSPSLQQKNKNQMNIKISVKQKELSAALKNMEYILCLIITHGCGPALEYVWQIQYYSIGEN